MKPLFQRKKSINYAFLTLGCNVEKDKHIPFVLRQLKQFMTIERLTPLMTTKPIDFPYVSDDFGNIAFLVSTKLELKSFQSVLKRLEVFCGRTQANSRIRPELVPMDLDLIVWNGEVIKAKDLKRSYVQDGLNYFALDLNHWDEYIKTL